MEKGKKENGNRMEKKISSLDRRKIGERCPVEREGKIRGVDSPT